MNRCAAVVRCLGSALVALIVATGCSSTSSGGDGPVIAITLTDAGCFPEEISGVSGPVTFSVTNDGSAAVTEFEVLKGDRIVGEVENVIPGVDRSFSLILGSGEYSTKCPGGSDNEGGTLVMSADPAE